MILSFENIGLFLFFLCFNFGVLEFINMREKYSILVGGNFLLMFILFVLLNVPFFNVFIHSITSLFTAVLLFLLFSIGKNESSNHSKDNYTNKPLELKVTKGKSVHYFDPYENFLVYAGANGGKTASIGKPLLVQFLELGFSAFVYDAKEFDYAKTIYGYFQRCNKDGLYFANFNNVNLSNQFNPIKPSLFSNSTVFEEVNEEFLKSLKGKNSKEDEWFSASLGLYKGISWLFFKHWKEYCTIPHIANFFLHRSTEDLVTLLSKDYKAKAYASAFLKVQDSEKTLASIQFNLSNSLSKIANNENLCFILTGDDFDFDFTNPEKPISFCLCNSHQISNTLSPIMGALVNISSKQYTLDNKNPMLYCLDEATTFNIPDFEKMPSLLREFRVAFLMLTQSSSKVEKLYGKLDLNSIHSNFTNKFFGKTGDVHAVKEYQQLFQMVMNSYKSESKNYGKSYSEGETTSKRKEFKFDVDFFSHLKSGEFVAVCGASNYVDYHKRFIPYDKNLDREPPMVRDTIITSNDLELYHKNIIKQVYKLTL